MAIFYVFFAIGLFLEIAFITNTKDEINKKNKKVVNIVLMVLLMLIAGLRSHLTGADTAAYMGQYYSFYYGYSKSIGYYFNVFVDSLKLSEYRDTYMWQLFVKLSVVLRIYPQVWLALVSSIFIFCAYVTIKRYSDDPVISWIYLVCIYVFSFVLQGLRQSIAMSIVLLSINFVHKKKLGLFLVFIFLAYLFHQSSLAFIIVYPLRNLKTTLKSVLIIAISFFLVIVFPSVFGFLLEYFATDSRFDGYLNTKYMLTLSGAYVYTAIYLLCFYFKDDVVKEDERNNVLYTISLIGIIAQMCSTIIAEMFRVALYFSMFNMILVANTMCVVDNKIQYNNKIEKNSYRIILILVFVLYFYISSSSNKYFFFWQG